MQITRPFAMRAATFGFTTSSPRIPAPPSSNGLGLLRECHAYRLQWTALLRLSLREMPRRQQIWLMKLQILFLVRKRLVLPVRNMLLALLRAQQCVGRV